MTLRLPVLTIFSLASPAPRGDGGAEEIAEKRGDDAIHRCRIIGDAPDLPLAVLATDDVELIADQQAVIILLAAGANARIAIVADLDDHRRPGQPLEGRLRPRQGRRRHRQQQRQEQGKPPGHRSLPGSFRPGISSQLSGRRARIIARPANRD
jgi:hypothetical protein